MKESLETRLGVFFALALLALAIVLEMVGSFETLKPGLHIQARFDDILELKVGDPVKMAGKQIGFVEDIRFSGQKVLVKMKITDPEAYITTDSKATVRYSGLLGRNYVSIDFGAPDSPRVIPGAELATEQQPDLNQLMTRLSNVASGIEHLTESFKDINLEELVRPLTDFLKDTGPHLNQILTNVSEISAQLRSGRGTVGRLIYDDSLYEEALNTATNIHQTVRNADQLIADLRQIVENIRRGEGTLGKLTVDATLYSEAARAIQQLREIFEKINRGEGTVGRLVNDPSILEEARTTLRKVDQATDSLQDQGPLSIISILMNPLF